MHSAAEKCTVHAQCVHSALCNAWCAACSLHSVQCVNSAMRGVHSAQCTLQCDDTTEAEVTGGAASGALQIAWRGLTLEVGGSLVLFSYSNVCNVKASPLDTVPSVTALVLKHRRLLLVGCLHCKVLRDTPVPSLCHLVPVSVSLSLKPNACTTSFKSLIFLLTGLW